MMNVLKLLHCRWKHHVGRMDPRVVQYYVLYERQDHLKHVQTKLFGQYKQVMNYEDALDREIYDKLLEALNNIPDAEEVSIRVSERELFFGDPKQARAILSSVAYGYPFRDLRISFIDGTTVPLHTRILFTDIHDEVYQTIFHAVPYVIQMERANDHTVLRADFLTRVEVDNILDRNIDLTQFGI